MAPCRQPGMKRLLCLKAKNSLGRFAPSALPHYNNGIRGPWSARLLANGLVLHCEYASCRPSRGSLASTSTAVVAGRLASQQFYVLTCTAATTAVMSVKCLMLACGVQVQTHSLASAATLSEHSLSLPVLRSTPTAAATVTAGTIMTTSQP